ncbi:hypothetical protein QA640_37165 [Bradyrhizobium sp. CB82]|uniref:hypothetical protein n=1 Tax=Bradyrhizobium sp. CB82 TaxID=3039159 RepID=UPI0024B19D55|nr:hypothetical protein [Bradyrhizobium sp. CB82]WFU45377.1 hypothetical protein QA640_37165 [Bradyrhizobium sp. CB82]
MRTGHIAATKWLLLPPGGIGAPAWLDLPAEARAALTSLMTQLILDHAAMTVTPPAKEVDHDL